MATTMAADDDDGGNLVSARSRRMATGVQKWYSQKKGKEKVVTQGAGTLKGGLLGAYDK
jgi:hypothetical protein